MLLLGLLGLVVSCTRVPQLPPLAPGTVIVAFGDSLTYGVGAAPEQSYPVVLEELTGLRVINAGLPGEISRAGLLRLPAVLDEHRPQLLLLCHGGNDMLNQLDGARLAENLRAMTRLALDRGIPVVLIGVPRPGILLDTADVYREIADELGVPLEDRALERIEGDRALKSDAIHPNADGYRRLAEAVEALLVRAGALPGARARRVSYGPPGGARSGPPGKRI